MGTNLYYLGVMSSDGEATSSGFQGFGWTGALGYSFNPKHAIEAGFMQNHTEFEEDEVTDGISVTTRDTHSNVAYLTWRGTIPIKDRFSLFGKLGGHVL